MAAAENTQTTKQKLGQFMTTNVDNILQGISIPTGVKTVVEPFCGNGDLLKIVLPGVAIEKYDIDSKLEGVIKQDTLLNPPNYAGKFVLTNPPYLARNKSKDKTLFDKYDTNDLYKCAMLEMLNPDNRPDGGILIVPLNFWSSIRKSDIDLRRKFMNTFNIVQLNIFEEQVFDDTAYTVCAFLFIAATENREINIDVFPSKMNMKVMLSDQNNFTIGGEIYDLPCRGDYTMTRLTTKNATNANNKILIKCIDDGPDNQIGLSIADKVYVDETANQSARSYASVIIKPPLDNDQQAALVADVNAFLLANRDKYHSLFLTNYRESKKNNSRKRISFQLLYKIMEHILDKQIPANLDQLTIN